MDTTIITKENEIEETQNQLMTLVDEAPTASSTVPLSSGGEKSVTSQETRQHLLTDFLKREVILYKGTISSSQPQMTILARLTFPLDLLDHPMYGPKLDGFRFMRGLAEVRIVINAQPFQAGIFRMVYFPVLSPDDNYNTSLGTMKQLTGLNGVDINLESKEPMVIEIPFIYPLPSYDMIVEPDAYANMVFVVYSPLSGGTADFTVFARFKEIDVSMPTSQTIPSTRRAMRYLQQMGDDDIDRVIIRRMRNKALVKMGLWVVGIVNIFLLFIQGYLNRPQRYKQQMGEVESAKPGGMISGVASAVSGVSQLVSGLPFIGQFAKPVGAIASLVGNVASAFGWSKPLTSQVPTITRPKLVTGMNNYDYPENSNQMGLSALNATDVTKDLFGTKMDEMSFQSLCRVPQYINEFSISTSTENDALVFKQELNPVIMTSVQRNIGSSITYETTNLGFVACMFEQWRGSLMLNFKMAKTIFHSMRLAIVYFNTEEEPPDVYDYVSMKNYQVIWDIRETHESLIGIPYIQPIEWLNVSQNDTNFKSSIGFVGVYVLNKLVVASAASNSVNVLVECFAGEDFALSIPKNPRIGNYYVKPITADSGMKRGSLIVNMDGLVAALSIPWRTIPVDLGVETTYNITDLPNGLRDSLGVVITSLSVERTIQHFTVHYNTENYSAEIQYGLLQYILQPMLVWPAAVVQQQTTMKTTSVTATERVTEATTVSSVPATVVKLTGTTGQMWMYLDGVYHPVKEGYTAIHLGKKILFNLSGFKQATVEELKVKVSHEDLKYTMIVYSVHERPLTLFKEYYVFEENSFQRTWEQQIGKEEAISRPYFEKITGETVISDDPVSTTVGESIVSFRQLCKRYTSYKEIAMTNTQSLGGGSYAMFDPHGFDGSDGQVVDYLSMVAPLYRFYNGEIRYKFVIKNTNDHTVYHGPIDVYLLSNYNLNSPPAVPSLVSSHFVMFSGIEGMGEFTVPYYNRNNKTILGDTRNSGQLAPIPHRMLIKINGPSTNLKLYLWRSMGEYFSFGTTLSAPLLVGTSV